MTIALSQYNLLLQAYRDGLSIGLVTRAEIVAWADDLIVKTDEPDYFLIEISMSKDQKDLINILNNIAPPTESTIPKRALLGLVNQLFIENKSDHTEIIALITDLLYNFDNLSTYERGMYYTFDDYYLYYHSINDEGLIADLQAFLSIYAEFKFDNYTDWPEIEKKVNYHIENDVASPPEGLHFPPTTVKETPKISFTVIMAFMGVALLVIIVIGYFTKFDTRVMNFLQIIIIIMTITFFRSRTS